jgi:hypothetical protein
MRVAVSTSYALVVILRENQRKAIRRMEKAYLGASVLQARRALFPVAGPSIANTTLKREVVFPHPARFHIEAGIVGP